MMLYLYIGLGLVILAAITVFILKKKKKLGASSTPKVDEVDFEKLEWLYATTRVNGKNAVLDQPRISNLSCNGKELFFKWDTGLDVWGISHTAPAAACAVFFNENGVWRGGMFEWISTSRTQRSLNNTTSYLTWKQSGVKLPVRGEIAFVVISSNGKLRSNVIKCVV